MRYAWQHLRQEASMNARYYLSLPDPAAISSAGPWAFRAHGSAGLAEVLQAALRTNDLFLRWRAAQDDPDAVDPALGATDPDATVTGEQIDLHVELVATTSVGSAVLKHRMRLLAGHAWQLRDVTAA
jgi:hypothetical protein